MEFINRRNLLKLGAALSLIPVLGKIKLPKVELLPTKAVDGVISSDKVSDKIYPMPLIFDINRGKWLCDKPNLNPQQIKFIKSLNKKRGIYEDI